MEAPSQLRCGQEGNATFSLELLSRIQQAGFPQKSREGPRMVMLSTSVSFSLACNSLEERPVPYLSGGSQSNRAGCLRGAWLCPPLSYHPLTQALRCGIALLQVGGRILEIRKDSSKRSRYRVGEEPHSPAKRCLGNLC